MLHSIARHSLVEPAVCDPASFSPEHTRCISLGALMNFPVSVATKSDQVALGILSLMASESSVMNFDRGERAAGLAAPTVPFEDLLVQPG